MSQSDSSQPSDVLPLPTPLPTSPVLPTGREEEAKVEEIRRSVGHDGSIQRKASPIAINQVLNWNWRSIMSLVTLWGAYLSVNASYSIIAPFFPNEAAARGATSTVIGVIVSVSSLCTAIFAPVFGYFLPRLGVRLTLLSGLLLVGGAYVLLGFTYMMPSGWVFIMMCILLQLTEGVGSAMFITAVLAIPLQLFPESVATVTGLMMFAAGMGLAVGPPIGGALYAAGGFGAPFWATGGLSLLFIPLCFLNVKVSSCKQFTLDLQALRKLSTDFTLYIVLLGTVIVMAALTFPSPILQPYLSKEFGLNEEQVGLVFMVAPLIYLILGLFIGPITDKLGPRYFIVAGLLTIGIAYFLFGPSTFISTPKLWLVIAGYGTVGIGVALVVVPSFADLLITTQTHNPDKDVTGLISGLVNSCFSVGLFLGPLTSGALYQVLGFQTSATICGEIVLAEGFLLLGITLIDKLHRRCSK